VDAAVTPAGSVVRYHELGCVEDGDLPEICVRVFDEAVPEDVELPVSGAGLGAPNHGEFDAAGRGLAAGRVDVDDGVE